MSDEDDKKIGLVKLLPLVGRRLSQQFVPLAGKQGVVKEMVEGAEQASN